MSFVCSVFFLFLYYPVVVWRKESICLFGAIVNLCQIEPVSDRKCLLIDAGSTDHEQFLILRAMTERVFQGREAVATRQLLCRSRQHDVPSVRKSSFRETLECLSAHDDGMAGGKTLESFQVVGQPVEQFVVFANGPVPRHGRNDVDRHNTDVLILYTYGRLDMIPRIIVLQLEILIVEVEQILHVGVDAHGGQWSRRTCELQLCLFDVVQIEMGVTGCVDKLPGLQS